MVVSVVVVVVILVVSQLRFEARENPTPFSLKITGSTFNARPVCV